MDDSSYLDTIRATIEDNNIVPVLGNDISKVRLTKSEFDNLENSSILIDDAVKYEDDIILNLYDYLAIRLWNDYGRKGAIPKLCTLNNVVTQLQLEQQLGLWDIKNKIIKMVSNFTDEQMFLDPYKKIAKITDFETILTVNFDNFLERAFEANNNRQVNDSINFTIQDVALDQERDHDPALVDIVNLMGNIRGGTDFALTEEQSLEYLYKLSSRKDEIAKHLFNIIKNKSILLIGCSFPDWFMRFFIRTISKERFWGANKSKYVASDRTAQDIHLRHFLESNSSNTKVIKIGSQPDPDGKMNTSFNDSIEFIDKLYDAWSKNKGDEAKKIRYREKVFLSYSWDDKNFVEKLKNEFEKNGVSVFFDDDYLKTGDRFADKINNYIKECDYFIPLISKNAIKDQSRYVYDEEWRTAIILDDLLEKRYIRPYLIDDTSPLNDRIPDKMRKLNINKVESVEDFGTIVRQFIKENNLTSV